LILKSYDFEPKFLGEHVLKRRLEKGQMQKEAAYEIGVNSWTVMNWERGNTEPVVASIPAILKYLGYDPLPKPETLPERLLAKRRERGWSIKEGAFALGIDPSTWGNWERGQLVLYRQHRELLAKFLGISAESLSKEMQSRWVRAHKLE